MEAALFTIIFMTGSTASQAMYYCLLDVFLRQFTVVKSGAIKATKKNSPKVAVMAS